MYIIYFLICYTFLFSHYLIFNLCGNVFFFSYVQIVIMKNSYYNKKFLLSQKYLYFNGSNFFMLYENFYYVFHTPFGW